jgi:sugar phosphate isomerase/epimerase
VAEFHGRPRRETRSCRHNVKDVEGHARSENFHIGVCPEPKYLERRRRLKLVERALEMAREAGSRGAAGHHGGIGRAVGGPRPR